jgi:hypothetical protein
MVFSALPVAMIDTINSTARSIMKQGFSKLLD